MSRSGTGAGSAGAERGVGPRRVVGQPAVPAHGFGRAGEPPGVLHQLAHLAVELGAEAQRDHHGADGQVAGDGSGHHERDGGHVAGGEAAPSRRGHQAGAHVGGPLAPVDRRERLAVAPLELAGQVEDADLLAGRRQGGQLGQQAHAPSLLGVLGPHPLPHLLDAQAEHERRYPGQGQQEQHGVERAEHDERGHHLDHAPQRPRDRHERVVQRPSLPADHADPVLVLRSFVVLEARRARDVAHHLLVEQDDRVLAHAHAQGERRPVEHPVRRGQAGDDQGARQPPWCRRH